MRYRSFVTLVSAALLAGSLAQAQGVSRLGGPRNTPPAGFTGQQFVDNDGCVFLKAGYGGQVSWVPRVTATHRPLCGFPPTFGAAVAAAVAADIAPDPQAEVASAAPAPAAPAPRAVVVAPVVVAQPAAPVAPAAPHRSLMAMLFGPPAVGNPIQLVPVPAQPVPAPVQTAPIDVAQPAYQTAANTAQAQCVPGSPVLETVLLRMGGTALVCTRGDGTLTGWRPPLFPAGAVGAALTPHMMQGATLQSGGYVTVPTVNSASIPTPPRGYKLAWKDDRLNPMRGVGIAAGQAQQDQVWTRQIPATLAAAPSPVARVTVSTMSAPSNAPLAGAAYVQVGTFGQPANADAVRARLAALGLPVSTGRITRKGKLLEIVYAGPFATPLMAQSALTTARGAGFGDAILK